MTASNVQDKLTELATALDVPGVAVGVLVDGEEHYAFHGVTSVENPLPVDENTLFQFGSTGKTFTATAMMRLVEQGKVDLDAPVRTYVPELKLKDEDVAQRVTVLQLFNHTAGWEGDMMDNTGEGDDALEKYVARMERLEQSSPLGATVSYNNASLSLAGRVIEKVTGKTYEQAVKELLFEPLGLDQTFFFMTEIMTRRFAVGHRREEDGTITIARPWALPRGGAPAGGMSATARDQIAWAKFHLGDGTAPDGTRLLSKELLDRMKQPTADMRGSALGDYVGISWLMRDIDGVRVVGHGGTTNGQHSEFVTVPERGFALVSLTNCGPNGPELNDALQKWAFEHYLGLIDKEPEPISLTAEQLAPYTGRYETIAATVEITIDGGRLLANVQIKPEMAAVLRESGEDVPEEQPPVPLALLSEDGDNYVVPEGPGKGMKGYFARGADGTVDGVHVGGRLATRVAVVPSPAAATDDAILRA
ncbi:MAG TPA: serine hydrolase domain-containing protein [Mycobacteriales bacterium]|nr:serine hydrolase domain-containing protein [Mycobacteriales bacterium]